MTKWFASFAMLTTFIFLTGCGFKDIDKRFFVTQMGVDYSGDEDKPYKVTLELAIPKPQIEPGKEQFQIVQEKGASITEAIRLMKSLVDKELEFGHTKVILFGEELCSRGLKEPLDWLTRRRDIQKIAFLGMGKPDAETIVRTKPESERLPGNALILSFAQEGTESAYIVTEYLFDFYRRVVNKGIDPILPVVEKQGETRYNIRRVAIFSNEKLKKVLSPDETRLFNELAYQIHKFDASPNSDHEKIMLSFDSLTVKSHFDQPGADTTLVIDVKADGVIEESNLTVQEKDWNKYQEAFEFTFKTRYIDLLKEFQKLNIDPLGLGEKYLAQFHGAKWSDWKEIYPHIHFDVNADVIIRAPGNIK